MSIQRQMTSIVFAFLFVSLFIVGCSTSEVPPEKVNIEREAEDILSKYFYQNFPETEVIDKCLVEIDNDGLPELLLALNTYSGARDDLASIKNGLTPLYVAVVFSKGSNPTESMGVVGKTVPKGFSFKGTHLFTVEKEGEHVDLVKVKAVNSQGEEHYFILKVTVEKDGTRCFS